MSKVRFLLRRLLLRRLVLLGAMFALAACDPSAFGGPRVQSGQPVKVALLVPGGSGDAQFDLIARDLTNAARLAVADLDGVAIDLQVYETGRSAQRAAQLAQQAVADGAGIIVGPLDASSANAAAVAVAGQNVNVLSFSNNPAIAGGNTFILGNTFQNTADRLVQYGRRNGKSRYMVVSGRTAAEEVANAAVIEAIQSRGGTVVGNSQFSMSQEGVVAAVPAIAEGAVASGADALFLTSSTQDALPLLTQLLPERGLTPNVVQYIGLTRWDIPASALSLPGVQGSWFALPDASATQQFRQRFTSAYGNNPHPLAGLAYDGVAAVGALVKSRGSNALTRSALTQRNGFAGASGVFRFRDNGTNQRALAVATVRNRQVIVIDPAPRRLGTAGF
ncbi:MAG: penicillin-binding protein activator [Rhodobacteraceae bacterium]|nr:penicillin-binding protein activator [Paracoccaceae bacterium]